MTDPNPAFKDNRDSVSPTEASEWEQAAPEVVRQKGTEATPTPTAERALDASDIKMTVEDDLYGKAKAKRVVIRGKVIHDAGDDS